MFKDLIDNSLVDFFESFSTYIFINQDELIDRYVYVPEKICEYPECKKVLKEDQNEYCKKHFICVQKERIREDKNNDIGNFDLEHIEDNLYKDFFGMVFKIEDDVAEFYGVYTDDVLVLEK